MRLEVGDQVKLVDEDLRGVVVKVSENLITVQSEEGFDYQYPKEALIKLETDGSVQHTVVINQDLSSKLSTSKVNRVPSFIDLSGKKPIIDLHIETLNPLRSFNTNHEALLFQLEAVEQAILQAKLKRWRNLIFIHGVGSGKLRKSLQDLLSEKYPEVEYFDASYKNYGQGAIEIIIHGLGQL